MIDYRTELLAALADHAIDTQDVPEWRRMERYADARTIKSYRGPALHERAIIRAARALVAEGWLETWPGESERWRLRAPYRATALRSAERSVST